MDLVVLTLDVVLELDRLHAPLLPPAHLDAAKVAAAHEGIHLTRGDVENLRDVSQLEESLFAGGHSPSFPRGRGRRVNRTLAPVNGLVLETTMRTRGAIRGRFEAHSGGMR